MLRFTLRRLLLSLPVLGIVSTAIFFLIHMIPGDPVVQMLGERAAPLEIEELRRKLGLDQPLLTQFVNFWKGLLQADLGTSIKFKRPVTEILRERYPATMSLALV
ncbi:MAG: ABC transporter permease, partial [Acidobacteria bacterium]|nr:ABC transporter permease [Acidobacteriota bacterium]